MNVVLSFFTILIEILFLVHLAVLIHISFIIQKKSGSKYFSEPVEKKSQKTISMKIKQLINRFYFPKKKKEKKKFLEKYESLSSEFKLTN